MSQPCLRPDPARVVALTAMAAALVLLADVALAQTPFGAPRGPAPAASTGLFGWLLDMQSHFYRQISGALRAAAKDPGAVWWLLALSFAYGVFHAAGPGHGKAVISSYLIANRETARRGIVLAFASALLQALVAIAIVGVGALLLNATARTMCSTERIIELASYGLIAAFGARLVWVKAAALGRVMHDARLPYGAVTSPTLAPDLRQIAPLAQVPVQARHSALPHHDHSHDAPLAHHGHGEGPAKGAPVSGHLHDHGHDHDHDAHCGHHHGPAPQDLAGPGGLRRGLAAIVAVGLRPCSGAILVLVFALSQGLFWAGVAATLLMGLGTALTVATIALVAVAARALAQRLTEARPRGLLLMRLGETVAAGLVCLFGLGLMFGLLAAERVTCF